MSVLPKRIAAIPAVRARSLPVVRQNDGSYIVVGRSHNYHVLVAQGRAYCNCTASKFGVRCSHRIAVETAENHKSLDRKST